MPDVVVAWATTDLVHAANFIDALLKRLLSQEGAGRRLKDTVIYLQDQLLPTLRLITRCGAEIEADPQHPRRDQWNLALHALCQTWKGSYHDLVRLGVLRSKGDDDNFPYEVVWWGWDVVSYRVDHLKDEINDALEILKSLILLDISAQFDLVLPRLDEVLKTIQIYGESVFMYRTDVQEVLRTIRGNEQDFKAVMAFQGSSQGDLTPHSCRLTDVNGEPAAIDIQLEFISDGLDRLLNQLAQQRANCITKTEKGDLDQLRREIKKQAASIRRLIDPTEESMDNKTDVLHTLNSVTFGKTCAMAHDVNLLMKRVVPGLERLSVSLKTQIRYIFSKRPVSPRRRTNSLDETRTASTVGVEMDSTRSSMPSPSTTTSPVVIVVEPPAEAPPTNDSTPAAFDVGPDEAHSPTIASGLPIIASQLPLLALLAADDTPPPSIPQRSSARLARPRNEGAPTQSPPPIPSQQLCPSRPPPPVPQSHPPTPPSSSASCEDLYSSQALFGSEPRRQTLPPAPASASCPASIAEDEVLSPMDEPRLMVAFLGRKVSASSLTLTPPASPEPGRV